MKPVVLLVDDSEESLNLIADNLSDDYAVYTAVNGIDALKVMQREAVQLVISEVMMPVMDGFELCRQIKADIQYNHIPIILLTGKNTLQSKIDGLELGADACIENPFSPRHLQVQIANLLDNRDKIRTHFANSPMVHIKTVAYSKANEIFLEKLYAVINCHITDLNLDVEQVATIMNMSRPTLYRKIKSISNLTPNELINIARLKKATELLMQGQFKMFEVSEMVGYTSQTHFGRNFLKQFGMSPTDYLNKARNEVQLRAV